MYNHVMGDLETLDIQPTAVILSLGAVKFNLEDEDSYDTLEATGRSYYRTLELPSQIELGRTMSIDTIKWWMEQNKIAQGVFKEKTVDVVKALRHFNSFCLDTKCLWGNGSSFDNVLLKSLYGDFETPFPFKFWNDMDLRTLAFIAGNPRLKIARGTEHNALDDAKFQVLKAQEYYRRIHRG